MLKQIISQPLSYRAIRALHICIVFGFIIFVQEFLRFPQAGWAGFSLMMIYAGFDNGTTLFRAYHRFWGMILGLFSGYILWFIGHLDYRLLILIIPVTVFFAYFLVGRAYSVPTIFTVNTAVIGTGYFAAHSEFSITAFLVDYTVCTIFAFVTCVVFEFFIFRKYGLMKRFIADTQKDVVNHLLGLINLLNQEKIDRNRWFNACINFNRSLNEVNNLVNNSAFEHSSEAVVGDEFNRFVLLTNKIFVALKALYSAYYTKRYHKHDYNQLFLQVQQDLIELQQLVNSQQNLTIQSGIIYDAQK